MDENDLPIIPDLPPAPLRNDPEDVFASKASNFVGSMNPWGQTVNAVAAAIHGWWTDILAAVPQVLGARDATFSASSEATAAANMAVSVVGAQEWVSGEEYEIGQSVWSPADLQTYRRRTTGAGTTDPSLDPVNWAAVQASAGGANLAQLHANALSF